MEPFDPDWEFEELVVNLNKRYTPGSVSSGRARNVLIRAWALCVGQHRARSELHQAIDRHGSRSQLRRVIHMAVSSLRDYEKFIGRLPVRGAIPTNAPALRAAFEALSLDGQLAFMKVSLGLLQEPKLLGRLADRELHQITTLAGTALRAFDLAAAVDELELLLSREEAHERIYQDWCDRHSWAFGNTHALRDMVRRLDSSSVVDLLLPDLSGYRDIVELKRPDCDVVCWDRSHRTFYFSAQTSKAIGQVNKYIDKLHDVARNGLSGAPQIVAFHPHARIVIGRSIDWSVDQTRALRGLNDRLHGVSVMTYDHLLAQARQILSTMYQAIGQ